MSGRKVVINKKQIHEKVDALAAQISEDYSGKDLILIGVLNGAFIFLADLARAITIPPPD